MHKRLQWVRSTLFLKSNGLFILSFFVFSHIFSQTNTFTNPAGGNWSVATNWSLGVVPTSDHDVVIPAAVSVSMNVPLAVAKSVTLNGGNVNSALTFVGTNDLTVTGAVTINPVTTNSTTVTLAVGAGSLSAGSVNIVNSTTGNRVATLTLSTGTITVSGNITGGANANRTVVQITGSGTINIGGTLSQGSLISSVNSTFNYNGSTPQTILLGGNHTYGNLHLNNSSTTGVVIPAAVTAANVLGNLEIQSGIFNNGGYAITLAAGKNFVVGAGSTFNLTGTSAMPTVSGAGAITLAPTSLVHFSGGIQTIAGLNYGSLSASGGIKTLAGNTTVANTLSIGSNLDLSTFFLTLSATSPAVQTIGGTSGVFSAGKMIIASGGGELRKSAIAPGQATYFFPIGDNTGTAEYSPVMLTFSGGTYAGFVAVSLVDDFHPNNTFTTTSLSRYWTITQTGFSGFTGTVVATYVDADVVGTEPDLRMGKWDGAEPWIRYTTPPNTTLNTLTAVGITSLSDFTGLSLAAALPVKLTNFTASLVDKTTILEWSTSEEINSSSFEVEHSTDGQHFTRLSIVKSNNSLTGSAYNYRHLTPASGDNYYRLKMVDIDARFEYSPIITLKYTATLRQLTAYPNPASSDITVQFGNAAKGATLRIIDMQGRHIKSIQVPTGSTMMQIKLTEMPRGMYRIVYESNNQKSVYSIQKN